MRVRIHRQHFISDIVLDELDGFSRGGVIGIDLLVRLERAVNQRVDSDEVLCDGLDEGFLGLDLLFKVLLRRIFHLRY